MIRAYENEHGIVEVGLFRGTRVTIKATGRRMKPPRYATKYVALYGYRLAKEGFDYRSHEGARAIIFDWLIDFCAAPAGGLYQRAVLQVDIDELISRDIEFLRLNDL